MFMEFRKLTRKLTYSWSLIFELLGHLAFRGRPVGSLWLNNP